MSPDALRWRAGVIKSGILDDYGDVEEPSLTPEERRFDDRCQHNDARFKTQRDADLGAMDHA